MSHACCCHRLGPSEEIAGVVAHLAENDEQVLGYLVAQLIFSNQHRRVLSGQRGDYTGCETTVLEHVPASQVLLNSEMLGACNVRYKHTVKTGEWIIITPAPDGMRVIYANDVFPIRRGKWPTVHHKDVNEIFNEGITSKLLRAPVTFWNTLSALHK